MRGMIAYDASLRLLTDHFCFFNLGYDNAYIFPAASKDESQVVRMLAAVQSTLSGLYMEVHSDQRSLQVARDAITSNSL